MKITFLLFILLFFISGCMIQDDSILEEFNEEQETISLCEDYFVNENIVWTVDYFDYYPWEYNQEEVCANPDLISGIIRNYDEQTFRDMCTKHNTLNTSNITLCSEAKTCFVKDYCLIEAQIQDDSDYCLDKEGIERDYCEIIYLRDNHGYRPGFNADCSNFTDENLKFFCEKAYRRKE